MSIIYEALKKIEEEKKGESHELPPIILSTPEGELCAPVRKSHRKTFLLSAIIALPCVFVFFILRGVTSRPSMPPAVPPPAVAKPVIKEVRIQPREILPIKIEMPPAVREPAPKPAEVASSTQAGRKLPELKLKGLSHSGTRSWAFINDRMLKTGDTVEGAEVTQILEDRVKLKYEGIEFTLNY